MAHRYFVSFAFNKGGQSGFGNMEICLDSEITSLKEILAIQQRAALSNALTMTVLHWIPLPAPDTEGDF